jgi:dihydroorotate dehydrogenase (fumarate)
MAGADAVMTASALLHNGPAFVNDLVNGLSEWMDRRGYRSIRQMKGILSQQQVADPSAFARANYIRIIEGWKNPYTLSGV